MPVLHKYVPSSEKEGYYIYAAHDGANVTYQVSALARSIFEKLSSCEVDEQIPDEVFYTLHRLGFVYTNQSGVDRPDGLDEIPTSGQSKRLPSDERETFFEKLLSSDSLETEERKEVRTYLDETGTDVEPDADLHGNWVPTQPDTDTYRGEVLRTFQDGAWGFVDSDDTDLEDDVFFHVNELEKTVLRPGMTVEFAYERTSEGFQVSHVRRCTDSLGRRLEEQDPGNREPDFDLPRDGEHVGISDLSEGDYVEALIDRRKGLKGLGKNGYLHIHNRRESSDGYLHIATRDAYMPVNQWKVVQITAIRKGYAEATIRSAPSDVEPPLYVP